MVEIKRVDNVQMLRKIGAGAGEFAFAAISDGEVTGFCIYRLEQDRVVLEKLFERDGDMVLADGIARAVAAAHRNAANTVVFSGEISIKKYVSFLGISRNYISIGDFIQSHCR